MSHAWQSIVLFRPVIKVCGCMHIDVSSRRRARPHPVSWSRNVEGLGRCQIAWRVCSFVVGFYHRVLVDAPLAVGGGGSGRCHIGGGSITAQRLTAKRTPRRIRRRVDVLFKTWASHSTSADVVGGIVCIRAGMPARRRVLRSLLFLRVWTCGCDCVRRLRTWRGRSRHDWRIECGSDGW